MGDSIKTTFWILVGLSLAMVVYFAVPFEGEIRRMIFPVFAVVGILWFILGGTLIYLVLKSKIKGKPKVYLLLVGGSAFAFLVFVLLHNLVYGLLIYFFGEGFWNGGDEPVFFLLAIIGCPIAFIVGVIGSLFNWKKISSQ